MGNHFAVIQNMLPGAWAVQLLLAGGCRGAAVSEVEYALQRDVLSREGLDGIALDGILREQGCLCSPLKVEFVKFVASEMRCLSTLREIGILASVKGIPLMAFKGCALAAAVYPRPGLRRFSDIDLCVQPENRVGLSEVLGRLGFQTSAGSCVYSREGLCVDIHDHPLHQLAEALVPADDNWWLSAQPLSERTGPVLRLTHSREFILALFHGGKHAFSRAIWLLDLALLAQALPEAELVEVVSRYRAERHLYCALLCLDEWFSVRLDESVVNLGRPPRSWDFLTRRFLRLVLDRRAPDFLGVLTPVWAIRGASRQGRYLLSALFPLEVPLGKRLSRLVRMLQTTASLGQNRNDSGQRPPNF